jgi:hypothetical protein
VTKREQLNILLDQGWFPTVLSFPGRNCELFEDAWSEHEKGQYPKLAILGDGAVLRMDNETGGVRFGAVPTKFPPSQVKWRIPECSRDEAVREFVEEVLSDPTVAAEGYNASVAWMRCCDSSGSGVFKWVWRVFVDGLDPSGFADTHDEALRKLAEWVLDNVMKGGK